MTRKPEYPGREHELRGIGIIHSGADQAITGTRPNADRVKDTPSPKTRSLEARARIKAARKRLRDSA